MCYPEGSKNGRHRAKNKFVNKHKDLTKTSDKGKKKKKADHKNDKKKLEQLGSKWGVEPPINWSKQYQQQRTKMEFLKNIAAAATAKAE